MINCERLARRSWPTLVALLVGLVLAASRVSADPLSLYVSDGGNSRVLKFSPPFSDGMAASVVIGQTDFTSGTGGLGQARLDGPIGIDHDVFGNLFVADGGNNRVLKFSQPTTLGEAARVVIGQPDFDTNLIGKAAKQTYLPSALTLTRQKGGALFVSTSNIDTFGAPVREFSAPFFNGMGAKLQIGDNGSIERFISAGGLAVDPSGNLFVADSTHDRVLIYNAPITNDETASIVLGAFDLSHSGEGVFYTPMGLALDPKGNLWVADSNDNRVLEFLPPFRNGKYPSLVIGQPSLPAKTGPHLTQDGLSFPTFLSFDNAGDLWVTDSGNGRVLEFVPPFSDGMNASVVIGQPDFTSNNVGTTANQFMIVEGITFAP